MQSSVTNFAFSSNGNGRPGGVIFSPAASLAAQVWMGWIRKVRIRILPVVQNALREPSPAADCSGALFLLFPLVILPQGWSAAVTDTPLHAPMNSLVAATCERRCRRDAAIPSGIEIPPTYFELWETPEKLIHEAHHGKRLKAAAFRETFALAHSIFDSIP